MYTLKFIQFREDNTKIHTCIHCPHFEANEKPTGEWSIIAYPTFTMEHGVERRITKTHERDELLTYDCCFVENENGKTIGNYHVKENSQP